MNNDEQNTQWYDGLNLDEESVSTIQNKGWQDANSIIKSYRELEKFSGQDKNWRSFLFLILSKSPVHNTKSIFFLFCDE